MRIFFIRHGETTGDVEDRYGGDYDDHLSDKGREQSIHLAEQLKDTGIQIVLASPLMRAKETAQYIAEAIGGGCVVAIRPELKERNQYGILTGIIKHEAKETHPELVTLLQDKMNTIEGAESYEDFSVRIQGAFNGLLELMEHSPVSTMAVVWHGGPMRVLFRDILKWGELKEIGDCAFVELENEAGVWTKKRSDRIVFDF